MYIIEKFEEQRKESLVTQKEFDEWKCLQSLSVEQQSRELKELGIGIQCVKEAVESQTNCEQDMVK